MSAPFASGQTIVLRDLTLIESEKVISLDESQLRLAGGRTLTWDQILQADVDDRFQQQVDANITNIGQPTFRLKNRILADNFVLAADSAQALIDSPDPHIRFLANRAMMRSHAHSGKTEPAVVCMLRAMLAQKEFARQIDPPMEHLLFEDNSFSSVVHDLLPVFSDGEAASQAIADIGELGNERVLVNKLPVASVYLSLLGATAGQNIGNLPFPDTLNHWRTLVPVALGRIGQRTLQHTISGQDETFRIAATFYWSTCDKNGSLEKRILGLLRIASAWRDKFPNIARLSLQQAAKIAQGTRFQKDLDKVASKTPDTRG